MSLQFSRATMLRLPLDVDLCEGLPRKSRLLPREPMSSRQQEGAMKKRKVTKVTRCHDEFSIVESEGEALGSENADGNPPSGLPVIASRDYPDLRVISPQTVARILKGEFQKLYEKVIFVDCRFPYEHKGGTLQGAISMTYPDQLENEFIHQATNHYQNHALVFFCEFSQHRAPKMIRHLRRVDRQRHIDTYPSLYYPNLYLVEGGYSKCYQSIREYCEPEKYICMNDIEYKQDCKKQFLLLRECWKRRSRATLAAM